MDIRLEISARNQSISQKGRPGTPHTEKTKQILREAAIRNELGGKIISKPFPYNKDGKIINLQSSYEYRVAEELDKNSINWTRPSYFIWTDAIGTDHRYYPDFYLNDYDIYLDPKNDYLIKKDKDKICRVQKQNNITVLILRENELTFEHIISRIGVAIT